MKCTAELTENYLQLCSSAGGFTLFSPVVLKSLELSVNTSSHQNDWTGWLSMTFKTTWLLKLWAYNNRRGLVRCYRVNVVIKFLSDTFRSCCNGTCLSGIFLFLSSHNIVPWFRFRQRKQERNRVWLVSNSDGDGLASPQKYPVASH